MAYIRDGRFVYRSRRIGNKIRSEYIGVVGSPMVEAIARLDAIENERRELERKNKQEAIEAASLQQDEIERLFEDVTEVMKRCLEEAGYHQHDRGEWRKRMVKND
ncbi:MAG: hypothetical protein HQM09_24530 [Candidatus Riflebacteria bacterium]|nr:hypothetical protein [Candidatus Riflebacteria bacterium]